VPRIDRYTKKDGTRVRAHDRWAPGARTELAALVVVGMVILGSGSGQIRIEKGAAGEGHAPRSSAPASEGAHR